MYVCSVLGGLVLVECLTKNYHFRGSRPTELPLQKSDRKLPKFSNFVTKTYHIQIMTGLND
uniref:Uncharacterized protein n=1 Tax=Aegilops tauschii subsp. strangulata TaxID=200361 RepID=A0A453ESE9_AEGTS